MTFNWQDVVNGAYETLGGVFVSLNAFDIWRKKEVAGQTLTTTIFFLSWGVWNIAYYPHLHQFWSTIGAWGVILSNSALLVLILYYRRRADDGAK